MPPTFDLNLILDGLEKVTRDKISNAFNNLITGVDEFLIKLVQSSIEDRKDIENTLKKEISFLQTEYLKTISAKNFKLVNEEIGLRNCNPNSEEKCKNTDIITDKYDHVVKIEDNGEKLKTYLNI